MSAAASIVYVTLEPCAHASERGPACADLIVGAGPAKVIVALEDPDPRTTGRGVERLRSAGIQVEVGKGAPESARTMAGWLMRQRLGRLARTDPRRVRPTR